MRARGGSWDHREAASRPPPRRRSCPLPSCPQAPCAVWRSLWDPDSPEHGHRRRACLKEGPAHRGKLAAQRWPFCPRAAVGSAKPPARPGERPGLHAHTLKWTAAPWLRRSGSQPPRPRAQEQTCPGTERGRLARAREGAVDTWNSVHWIQPFPLEKRLKQTHLLSPSLALLPILPGTTFVQSSQTYRQTLHNQD